MTDNIDGIFDNLNPDDFNVTTTAVHERPLGFSDDLFEVFLDHNLTAVRYAFAAADGKINAVATLANGAIERMFAPEDDESIGDYTRRLAREAKLMHAEWAFISNRTVVGTVLHGMVGSMDVQVGSKEAHAVAENMGTTREAVYWYAARLDNPGQPRRHGFLLIEGNHLGELFQGEMDQSVPSFDRILGI